MTSDCGVQISQIHPCREWVKARNEAARYQEASNYIVRVCRGRKFILFPSNGRVREAWTRSYRYNMIVRFWKVVRIFDTFSFSSNEM